MQIELYCPTCRSCSKVLPESAGAAALDRVFSESPSYALGDGETFEDAIFTTLSTQETVDCTECGRAMQVSEKTLGTLAQTMLSCM